MSNSRSDHLESNQATQELLDASHEPDFVALWDDPAELERFRDYIRNAPTVDGWVNLSTVVQDFEADNGIN